MTKLLVCVIGSTLVWTGCAEEANWSDSDSESKSKTKKKKKKKDAGLVDAQPGEPDAGVECSPSPEQEFIEVTSSPVSATTEGAANDHHPSSTGPDVSMRFELPDIDQIRVSAESPDLTWTPETYLGLCGVGTLFCTQDFASTVPARAIAHRRRAGTYYAVIDSGENSQSGTLTFSVSGVITPNGRCDVPLALSGALVCADGTTCDGTRCTTAAACSDGIDNDGDGERGYPYDPGCESLSDNDESDDCPDGPNCPECATPSDEDGDGSPGYPTDNGCDHIGDPTEHAGICETNQSTCPECSDGFDNDGDGDPTGYNVDMDDCGCDWAAETSEIPEF